MPVSPVVGISKRYDNQVSRSRPYFLITTRTYVGFGCCKWLDVSLLGKESAQRVFNQLYFGKELDPQGAFLGHRASMTKKKSLGSFLCLFEL